jgi:hypothetical protein
VTWRVGFLVKEEEERDKAPRSGLRHFFGTALVP